MEPWTLVFVALLAAPFVAAAGYGVRHLRSGGPSTDDTLEADPMVQTAKEAAELRTRRFL